MLRLDYAVSKVYSLWKRFWRDVFSSFKMHLWLPQVIVYRNSLKWFLTSYQSCLEKGAGELTSPLLRVENESTNYKVSTFYGFLMCFLLCSYILCVFIFLVFRWNFWISLSSSQVQPRLWHKGNVIPWRRHEYLYDVFSSGLLNTCSI